MTIAVAVPTAVDPTKPVTARGGQMPSAPLIALRVTATLTGTYPTGGEDFDPGALLQSLGNYDKAPDVLAVLPEQKSGYVWYWDRATNKLLAYWADYDAGADGALIEVANGTDLSTTPGTLDLVILAQ